MKTYLKDWDLMRVLRLALGIFILVQGITTREWMIAVLGGLFALMPLLNIGCCSAAGCNHTPLSRGKRKIEDTTFDEVG